MTGASSGIGSAVAESCAARGCELVLLGRDPVRLASVAKRTNGTPLEADLAVPGNAERIAEQAGPIDVLVNNAGIGLAGPFADTDREEVDRLVRTNLAGVLELTRTLLPGMLTRGHGHLVFVSSIAGRLGVAEESAYAASKGALDALAWSLRPELADAGVGVSVIVPGVVETEFFARRGRPYTRRRPKPLPPAQVAEALVRAVDANLPEVFVPPWLRIPVGLRAVLPRVYDRLAGRYG